MSSMRDIRSDNVCQLTAIFSSLTASRNARIQTNHSSIVKINIWDTFFVYSKKCAWENSPLIKLWEISESWSTPDLIHRTYLPVDHSNNADCQSTPAAMQLNHTSNNDFLCYRRQLHSQWLNYVASAPSSSPGNLPTWKIYVLWFYWMFWTIGRFTQACSTLDGVSTVCLNVLWTLSPLRVVTCLGKSFWYGLDEWTSFVPKV